MSAKHLSPAHSPVETVTATANQQTKEEEADETEKVRNHPIAKYS
jgi:hypothetical protein